MKFPTDDITFADNFQKYYLWLLYHQWEKLRSNSVLKF